jgi:hypothetical protein
MNPLQIIGTVVSAANGAAALYGALQTILGGGTADDQKGAINTVNTTVGNLMGNAPVSLTAYTKPLRLSSRVYIEEAVYRDPIITDTIKTIHTQYAGLVLAAMQMSRFVTKDRDVQSLLRVVATESNKPHVGVLEAIDPDYEEERREQERAREKREQDRAKHEQERARREAEKHELEKKRNEARDQRDKDKHEHDKAQDAERAQRERDKLDIQATRDMNRDTLDTIRAGNRDKLDKDRNARDAKKFEDEPAELKKKTEHAASIKAGTVPSGAAGKVVSLAGDNHVPAGKVVEITLTNPENDQASTTVNLFIQLAPYVVPQEIAVDFLTKDITPTFKQRWMQWRTGEISFWNDLVAGSDIHKRREMLRRMDPSGVLDDAINKQTQARGRVFGNLLANNSTRARNIANSVLIFSSDTIRRAKAESGVDISKTTDRQNFFNTSFSMILVVVDTLYNQVTFYYNGIDDSATFTFDQMQLASKGGGGLDMVAVMNALGQGRSPKF